MRVYLRSNRQPCSPLEPHDFHRNYRSHRKSHCRRGRTLWTQFAQQMRAEVEGRWCSLLIWLAVGKSTQRIRIAIWMILEESLTNRLTRVSSYSKQRKLNDLPFWLINWNQHTRKQMCSVFKSHFNHFSLVSTSTVGLRFSRAVIVVTVHCLIIRQLMRFSFTRSIPFIRHGTSKTDLRGTRA